MVFFLNRDPSHERSTSQSLLASGLSRTPVAATRDPVSGPRSAFTPKAAELLTRAPCRFLYTAAGFLSTSRFSRIRPEQPESLKQLPNPVQELE